MRNVSAAEPLTIGIVGAGFSGTALAATLYRLSTKPIRIILFDQSGQFGAGPAYSTPFTHHLLNVRARDMSAFEDSPTHFVEWLKVHPSLNQYCDASSPLDLQFFPRALYHEYLQSILQTLQNDTTGKLTLHFEKHEVVDILPEGRRATLTLSDHRQIIVDKVVLAIGPNSPAVFPFPVAQDGQSIHYPWDYTAHAAIPKHDTVLIVGTGLSMIDVVLTLYHTKHQGKIYAVSRHGLLPLPHLSLPMLPPLPPDFMAKEMQEPHNIRLLTKRLRTWCLDAAAEGHHWQSVIDALRLHIPSIWSGLDIYNKRQFIRHILSYWNIHRHRVPVPVLKILRQLEANQQLQMIGGQVIATRDGVSYIKARSSQQVINVPTNLLINCMGPSNCIKIDRKPLLQSLLARNIATLDSLQLGLATDSLGGLLNKQSETSELCYAIGAPTRGVFWGIGAVPEIRRHVFKLANHLL